MSDSLREAYSQGIDLLENLSFYRPTTWSSQAGFFLVKTADGSRER